MKIRLVALAVVLLGASTLLAAPPETEKLLLGLVLEQEKAMHREDVAAVMATIHPESPLASSTEALLKRVNASYDFRIVVTDLRVVKFTPTEAHVSFVQVTEKVNGPEFRPNRVHGTHILRKDAQGKWKFFDTKIGKVDYLDHK